MNVQQLAPQGEKPHPRHSPWLFWGALSVTLAITLTLIGVTIWLLKTQGIDQLYTRLGIIASIIAIISYPLLLLFTITKWPGRKEGHQLSPPQTQPFVIQVATQPATTPTSKDSQAAESPVWNIPYECNPFFTGREKILSQLHEQLATNNATALTQSQAISGLGGIGKTQIAIEYAYRYREKYQYILWINASSQEILQTEYITLADLLHIPQPEKDERYQTRLTALVKQWFVQHDSWLLILDNADDLNIVREFLPTGGKGHIILTTREHVTGNITSIAVEKMSQQEGISFLLRRAKLLQPGASLEQVTQEYRFQAEMIVKELDAFPLALDQAGAYIEETECAISDYLVRYRQQRQKLLARRGRSSPEHLPSVTTTFLLCFAQVTQQNIVAADLLRCLAFLASDDIPDDMLKEGAAELGPQLQEITTDESLFDEAISDLLRFSLIQRNNEQQASSLHRLVQTVLKDEMPPEEQHLRAERVVRAINHVFPWSDVTTWPLCQRYLPHAQVCATLIEQEHLVFPEAAQLLNRIASYLQDLALYTEAQLLFERALAISEQVLGPNHPDTATSLNNLAGLYDSQGKYEQAEPRYQRALAIREQALGPNHPDTATSLNNLAGLYDSQGKYEQAEPLYQRALAIIEKVLGTDHPSTIIVRNNYKSFLAETKKRGKSK